MSCGNQSTRVSDAFGFGIGPSSLPHVNDMRCSSLPSGATAVYTSGSAASVWVFPYGQGHVIGLAPDFYQSTAGWNTVVRLSTTEWNHYDTSCTLTIASLDIASRITIRPSLSAGLINIVDQETTEGSNPEHISISRESVATSHTSSTGFMRILFHHNAYRFPEFGSTWRISSAYTHIAKSWSEPSGDVRVCFMCPAGKYASLVGSTSCSECAPGTFSDSPGLTACTNCSAPEGHFCPSGTPSSSEWLICPPGYSCPGGAQDKLRCPAAQGKGWIYCPGPLTVTDMQSFSSKFTVSEICPKTPITSFGEPQYSRCELRWAWNDLYAGHANKSISFKMGTVGEWVVCSMTFCTPILVLHVSDSYSTHLGAIIN